MFTFFTPALPARQSGSYRLGGVSHVKGSVLEAKRCILYSRVSYVTDNNVTVATRALSRSRALALSCTLLHRTQSSRKRLSCRARPWTHPETRATLTLPLYSARQRSARRHAVVIAVLVRGESHAPARCRADRTPAVAPTAQHLSAFAGAQAAASGPPQCAHARAAAAAAAALPPGRSRSSSSSCGCSRRKADLQPADPAPCESVQAGQARQ